MKEDRMPQGEGEQRKKICEDVGHWFGPTVRMMLENHAKYGGRVPNKSICSRCGRVLNPLTVKVQKERGI